MGSAKRPGERDFFAGKPGGYMSSVGPHSQVIADLIATPCPLCQSSVDMYQDAINKKYGTNFKIPVVFYSQLMAVAFGMDPHKDASLQRNTIGSEMLEALGKKQREEAGAGSTNVKKFSSVPELAEEVHLDIREEMARCGRSGTNNKTPAALCHTGLDDTLAVTA